MKVSFSFCILLAFIDAGSSLQCEVCHEIGESCSGPMETCDSGKDTCGVIKHEIVQVPPMNTIPNGLQCPACYAENSYQCSENTVSCTGVQTQCFDIAGKITIGVLPLKTAMKGCTTESECAAPKGEKGLDVDFVRFECKPASSRGHKALGFAPRVALLPALSGLILVLPLS
ncbi:unnamed protein product [Eretmochelys imbricata]